MTSSAKHLRNGQKRWDYTKQAYKEYDSHCEPGLISVLVLSCGRPENTVRSLESTMQSAEHYEGELEWVLLDQGGCEDTYSYFMSLPVDRKVVVRQKNYGINHGLNQLWALSRGEYCMIHENDWLNAIPQFNLFAVAKDILDEKGDVGIIQLRAVWDNRENWGLGKPEYSPWSCNDDALEQARIPKWEERTNEGYRYFLSEFPNGFTNNPCIIRKTLYRECGPYPEPEIGTDPRHGETYYQKLVAETGCAIAHIGEELYYHIGQSPTKGG